MLTLFLLNCLGFASAMPSSPFVQTDWAIHHLDVNNECTIEIPYDNRSSQLITIVNVATSCSCLVSEAIPIKVAARETVYLKWRIDKSHIVDGATYQTVVTTKSDKNTDYLLNIKVDLDSPIAWEGNILPWKSGNDWSCHTLHITENVKYHVQDLRIGKSPSEFNSFLLAKSRGHWDLLVSPKPNLGVPPFSRELLLTCIYNQNLRKRVAINLQMLE